MNSFTVEEILEKYKEFPENIFENKMFTEEDVRKIFIEDTNNKDNRIWCLSIRAKNVFQKYEKGSQAVEYGNAFSFIYGLMYVFSEIVFNKLTKKNLYPEERMTRLKEDLVSDTACKGIEKFLLCNQNYYEGQQKDTKLKLSVYDETKPPYSYFVGNTSLTIFGVLSNAMNEMAIKEIYHLSRTDYYDIQKIEREYSSLRIDNIMPDEILLAERTGLSPKRVKNLLLLRNATKTISLDLSSKNTGNLNPDTDINYFDAIVSKSDVFREQVSSHDTVENNEEKEKIHECLKALDGDEYTVLSHLFDFSGGGTNSLKITADKMDKSVYYINKIKNSALQKLKKELLRKNVVTEPIRREKVFLEACNENPNELTFFSEKREKVTHSRFNFDDNDDEVIIFK